MSGLTLLAIIGDTGVFRCFLTPGDFFARLSVVRHICRATRLHRAVARLVVAEASSSLTG